MSDATELLGLLTNAIAGTKERNIAIAFSGGLDSAVIAKIASERMRATLYTAGATGCKDFAAAESAAKMLGLPLRKIEPSEAEVAEASQELAKTIRTDNLLILSYTLPLWFVCRSCSETAVVSGQGADELFGGYAKYQRSADAAGEMRRDLEKLASGGLEQKIASHFGKKLILPFLDRAVIRFSTALPLERKISGGRNKIILREAAEMLDLGLIAQRPKKAAQYGSGIAKVLSR
ncbi:MAG: asparagine synthase C-terminal domain-containing protein [Candidatus Aenigmatarchaeota archaeon]